MDKEKLEKCDEITLSRYIELRRKVLSDLSKIQHYILDEENGDTLDNVGEYTINSGNDLCEFELENNLNPNCSLFDIANYIQGVCDFDETNALIVK